MIKSFAITPLQRKVMQSQSEVTVLSCGRGTGKTACVALLAIYAMLRGERVLIVAPSFRQAKRDNYDSICRFLYDMGVDYHTNSIDLRIRFNRGEITVLSSYAATQETFRGATSISTLIFDEAGSQSHTAYALAIPTMRDLKGAKRKIFIVGTPPYLQDHWMAQASRRDDVNVFYGSAYDNPFVELDYIKMIEREYDGFPEDFKQREIYGKMIFDVSASSMFNDFHIVVADNKYPEEPVIAGLDIAGRGGDLTVMVIAQGKSVLAIEVQKTSTDEVLKGWIKQMHCRYQFDFLRYDATGFGHLLTFPDLQCKCVPVDFGGRGDVRFKTTRGRIYHKLAQKEVVYMPKLIYDKHGKMIEGELQATCYKFDESKLINLVAKEKIKELLGRSPDRADAMALAFSHYKPEVTKQDINVSPIFRGSKNDSDAPLDLRAITKSKFTSLRSL